MNLVERVKEILLQPKSEWKVIESEPGDPGTLYPNYVMILAAIPAVATFIGTSVIGFGSMRVGIGAGLWHAIVGYVLGLAGVYVMAYVIDFFAGVFEGRRNMDNAMKVAAFAPTAAWVAGVFGIIPMLSILSLLGLYSLYLLYTGIAALMKPAEGKVLIYTIAVIVVMFVIWMVIGGIVFAMFGMGAMM